MSALSRQCCSKGISTARLGARQEKIGVCRHPYRGTHTCAFPWAVAVAAACRCTEPVSRPAFEASWFPAVTTCNPVSAALHLGRSCCKGCWIHASLSSSLSQRCSRQAGH